MNVLSHERKPAYPQGFAVTPDRRHLAVITHWGVIRALTGQEVTNGACIRLT